MVLMISKGKHNATCMPQELVETKTEQMDSIYLTYINQEHRNMTSDYF